MWGLLIVHSISYLSLQAVRGPLARAFPVYEKVRELDDLESLCLHVNSLRNTYLPSAPCLLLSPTLIWKNDKKAFGKVRWVDSWFVTLNSLVDAPRYFCLLKREPHPFLSKKGVTRYFCLLKLDPHPFLLKKGLTRYFCLLKR